MILALTDFNLSYLSDSPEVALVVEGLILLGVGVAADRLRRRVRRDPSGIDGGTSREPAPATAIVPAGEAS